MAESSTLVAAMDRLWFHQIILLSEPISVACSRIIIGSPRSTMLQCCSSSSSESTFDQLEEEDKASINSSTSSISQDDCNNERKEEKGQEDIKASERPTRLRLNPLSNRSRSKRSSPSIYRPYKSLNCIDDIYKAQKLQRTVSYMNPKDLELQELQRFMDLGFQFGKGQVTTHMISVIPGLQRLRGHESNANKDYVTTLFEGEKCENEEANNEVAMRPYLSEAWLVKSPNSPLLRLRMASVSTRKEMKNCIKVWARTVASSIQPDQ